MKIGSRDFADPLVSLAVFVSLVLLFTLVAVLTSSPEAAVGGTRPFQTIPVHLLQLAAFGLALGAVVLLTYGRPGIPMLLLLPVLMILLDLDHIPAYIGVAQPIRPAHSFVFAISVLMITTIILRRVDLGMLGVSAILGHLGIDSGQFPPYSPLSYSYLEIQDYRVALLAGSVVFAALAGLSFRLLRRGKR